MKDMRTADHTPRRIAVAAVTAMLVVLVACTPSDPGAKLEAAAAQKLQEVMSADSQFRVYGLQVAGRSSSAATFDLLLEAAGTTGYDVSYEGLQGLVARDPEAARDALRQAFETKRGALKQVAALGLARIGDADALAWLEEQVEQSGAAASPEVLRFLAESGNPELAKRRLAESLASDEETVRDEAYAVLGAVGEPWAVEMLLQGLDKEHGQRRSEAIVALGNAGDPAVASRLHKFVNTQGLVFNTLHALGALGNPDSLPVLKKAAAHDEELVKVYAASAAWRAGDAETGEQVLGPLTVSPQKVTRLNLAQELGEVEQDLARGMLAAMAGDEDKEVRRAAMLSLLKRGGEDLTQIFLEGAQDDEYEVATVAIEGLGRWGDSGAFTVLEPMLEAENPYVAMSAAAAILEIRTREAAEPAA